MKPPAKPGGASASRFLRSPVVTVPRTGGARASLSGADPRHWLISKPRPDGEDVLILESFGARALPVFSFEQEAAAFLEERAAPRDGWRVQEVGAPALLSVLFGGAGVETVTLDPIPGVSNGLSACLVGTSRESFARRLTLRENLTDPAGRTTR